MMVQQNDESLTTVLEHSPVQRVTPGSYSVTLPGVAIIPTPSNVGIGSVVVRHSFIIIEQTVEQCI